MRTVRYAFSAGLLLFASHLFAQVPAPANGSQPSFERGPLSFTGLTGYAYKDDIAQPSDEQGIKFLGFELSATGGTFRIKRAGGASVVEGSISNLEISGEKSLVQGTNKPQLLIQKVGLTCTVQLTKDMTLVSYGGTISVPKGSTVEVVNSAKTKITGAAMTGQIGTLTVIAKNANWRNAKFELPYLPDAIPLDLQSRDGTSVTVDIPLDTLQPTVAQADFDARIGSSVSRRPFDVATDTYKSHLSGLTVGGFSVHLTKGRLDLTVRGISCTGELVAKLALAPPVPILTSGRLRISSLTANASASRESATLQAIQVKGVSLNPAMVSSTYFDENNDERRPPRKDAHLLPAAFAPAARSLTTNVVPSSVSISAREQQFLAELSLGSPGEQQHDAIAQARKQLTNYSEPGFLINIPSKQLSTLITSQLDSIHVPNTTAQFDKQQLLVTASIKDPAIGQKGITFVITLSPTIETSNLVLRYSLSLAALTVVDISGAISLEKLFGLIKSHSSDLQITVGDPNARVTVPIPTNIFEPISLSTTLPPDPATKTQVTLISAPTSLTLNLVGADLLIDSDGIHVLARLLLE